MASVQKRVRDGKTRWHARWRDGQGRDRSKVFDRRADAQRHAHQAEAAARRHAHLSADRDRITVGEWLDLWLDQVVAARCAAGSLAPTTAASYEEKVRNHIRPRLGHLNLSKLTVAHVDQALTDVLACGLSAGTASGVRRVLSKALTDAVRRDLVDRNVAAASTPPASEQLEPSAFTLDEAARIVTVLEDSPYGEVIRFAVITGLRASEVLGLRWPDVDLEAGTFTVRRTVHRIPKAAARVVPETGLVAGHGKTDASRRPTPMSDAAVQLLREHRKAQAEQRLAAVVWVDPDLVWATERGTVVDPSNLRKALDRAVAAAGVPTLTADGRGRGLHELRRTFATRLLADGVPVHVVQRLGRWASPQVLLNSYASTDADQLRDAAAKAAEGL